MCGGGDETVSHLSFRVFMLGVSPIQDSEQYHFFSMFREGLLKWGTLSYQFHKGKLMVLKPDGRLFSDKPNSQ